MRLCRFQCSTAMATTIPPMKSMLMSFRYSMHTCQEEESVSLGRFGLQASLNLG